MDVIKLWNEYSGELIGYLKKSTVNTSDAEDIASEVFLRALKNKSLLASMSSKQCRLWLYTTAKHILIDIARRKKLESRIIVTEEIYEDDLSAAAVSQVIRLLPKELQDLVAMRYFADMDSFTISKSLGIPAATVRTRLRKACSLLKKYWNEY